MKISTIAGFYDYQPQASPIFATVDQQSSQNLMADLIAKNQLLINSNNNANLSATYDYSVNDYSGYLFFSLGY